jgi:hypothetical protein
MLTENLKSSGTVTLVLTDEHGNVKATEKANLIVNTGLAFITSRMLGETSPIVSHIQLGSDESEYPVRPIDVDLTAPLLPRAALTQAGQQVQTTVANDSVQYVASFIAGQAVGPIREAGLFTAVAGGTMIARTKFLVINKGALDTLAITWKIAIAQ